jgi:hypothetical protein
MSAPHGPIDVHIDELVLEGVAAGERAAVAHAFATALADRLARDGVPPAVLRGGDRREIVVAAPGCRAGRLGADVGAAVYRGLVDE